MKNKNADFNLTLSKEEVKAILLGLGKLPFEEVYQLIDKIIKQTADESKRMKKT
jgi:hypothetical protein